MWDVLEILLGVVAWFVPLAYVVVAGLFHSRAKHEPEFASKLIGWLFAINFGLAVLLLAYVFDLPLSSPDDF